MLTLYMHPLASFCWKVLIGLYESDVPFHAHVVDLSREDDREALRRLWPFAKMPVLRDEARDRTVAESTTILEHLARHHPGRATLVPGDPELAAEVRAVDRVFDLYVHEPMQKIVDDRIRPPDAKDPLGVSRARATLAVAYDLIERRAAERVWAAGDAFTLADCSAAPALHYANEVQPLDGSHPHTAAYLARLRARPSFARVLREAAPYAHMFPRSP